MSIHPQSAATLSADNPELQLARRFIEQTDTHVFLTGKAGTGKTTFLKELRKDSPKRMIVVAPTGVAAINAGGVTIHSFFQLPLSPYIPGSSFSDNGWKQYSFSKEKKNILRSLDLLVIDEISMVRADLLDAIDQVMRRYKDHSKPFGGVQLLMIGDLQQLSPVIKEGDAKMLSPYYPILYFFGSHALRESKYVTIELKTIYRQSDRHFVDILNAIRENRVDAQLLAALNKRYMPDFKSKNGDGYIRLTTHNLTAQQYNSRQLDALSGKAYTFTAEVKGNFNEALYPAEPLLELKAGAQVMFIRNDDSGRQRYYNGKIGRIHTLTANGITVLCDDSNIPITVERTEWTNSRYILDKDTKEIREEIDGTFRQYPLRLAWAITIHKSQGLTFEKAIIDAGASFAHGQVYVALSRCKTLEGLVLATPLTASAVISDNTVNDFIDAVEVQTGRIAKELERMQYAYFFKLLDELFDFKGLRRDFDYVLRLLDEFFYRLYPALTERYKQTVPSLHEQMTVVAEKFRLQYSALMQQSGDFTENRHLQERINKASAYFRQTLEGLLSELLIDTKVETDNQTTRKRMEEALFNLRETFCLKRELMKYFSNHPFTIPEYLHCKAVATIEGSGLFFSQSKKESKKNAIPSAPLADSIPTDIRYPRLYKDLQDWRRQKSAELSLPAYTILQQKALICMANSLPETMGQLIDIPYFGKRSGEKFGKEILDIIRQFVQEHADEVGERPAPISRSGLKLQPKAKQQKIPTEEKTPKVKTERQTYLLYKEGKSIGEIASIRNLNPSTIESHLARCIMQGILPLELFVPEEKARRIHEVLRQTKQLSAAKEMLGEAFTYGEIRMVLAEIEKNKK